MSKCMSVVFGKPQLLPKSRDGLDYLFPFTVVDYELLGKPEELSKTTHHTIHVGISGSLIADWNYSDDELVKVLFEFGKRHISEKIKDRILTERESIELNSTNTQTEQPFIPSRIKNSIGANVLINLPDKANLSITNEITLAAKIIDTRDNINALFKNSHKDNLLQLHQERNLLELFRSTSSQEEFVYRLTSLANLATSLNNDVLRKITDIQDTKIKSIGLLEEYLKKEQFEDSDRAILVLRQINKLRQCYPVHGDQVQGVIEAYKFFNIEYPVTDFSDAWKVLLLNYFEALNLILIGLR